MNGHWNDEQLFVLASMGLVSVLGIVNGLEPAYLGAAADAVQVGLFALIVFGCIAIPLLEDTGGRRL